MSEHSRYPRDWPGNRRSRGDRTYAEAIPRGTRDNHTHGDRFLTDDELRNHRYIDRDNAPVAENYPNHDFTAEQHPHDAHSHEHYETDYGYSTGHYQTDSNYRNDESRTSYPARVEPKSQEDVWREKHSHITFNDSDLTDIEHSKHSTWTRTLAGYCGVAAIIATIGFLAFSTIPDLSPQDIIAMDGYEGEQPIKTPFNLASLHDCEAGTACAEELKFKVTPLATTAISTTESTADSTTLTQNGSVEVSNAVAPSRIQSDASVEYRVVEEIPATSNTLKATSSSTQPNSTLTILQQWSNVRSSPDINGDILTSLAAGKTVTKISQTGKWVEIQVDERPSVTGYMHSSTVAPR